MEVKFLTDGKKLTPVSIVLILLVGLIFVVLKGPEEKPTPKPKPRPVKAARHYNPGTPEGKLATLQERYYGDPSSESAPKFAKSISHLIENTTESQRIAIADSIVKFRELATEGNKYPDPDFLTSAQMLVDAVPKGGSVNLPEVAANLATSVQQDR